MTPKRKPVSKTTGEENEGENFLKEREGQKKRDKGCKDGQMRTSLIQGERRGYIRQA